MVGTKKYSMAQVKLFMTDMITEKTSAFVFIRFQSRSFVVSPTDCNLINEFQNARSKTKTR